MLAIYDGFPIRQCTPRLSVRHPMLAPARWPGWAGARALRRFGLARGVRGGRRAGTRRLVHRRPAGGGRGQRAAEKAGEPATVRGGRRHPPAAGHPDPDRSPVPPRPQPRGLSGDRRCRSAWTRLGDSRRSATAGWPDRGWRLPGRATGGRPRRPRDGRDRAAPPAPLPAAGIEETERIADWLEQPGARIIDIIGDWMWPLHAVLDHDGLVRHALVPVGTGREGDPAPTSVPQQARRVRQRRDRPPQYGERMTTRQGDAARAPLPGSPGGRLGAVRRGADRARPDDPGAHLPGLDSGRSRLAPGRGPVVLVPGDPPSADPPARHHRAGSGSTRFVRGVARVRRALRDGPDRRARVLGTERACLDLVSRADGRLCLSPTGP